MGADKGNLQVVIEDVDVILEHCPITFVVLLYILYSSFLLS